jgi:hypothetical protein
MNENVRRTDTKKCSVCGLTKVLNGKNFYKNSTCGACYQRRYKKENPRKYRSIKLKHLYGITIEQYEQKLTKQHGCCEICGVSENKGWNNKVQNFVVDHNHKTKKVRGLLCHNCNKNVGAVELWQEKITAYLKKYQN